MDQARPGSMYFGCIDADCKARAIVRNNLFIKSGAAHYHSETHDEILTVESVYAKMKRLASLDTRVPLKQIYYACIREVPAKASGILHWKREE